MSDAYTTSVKLTDAELLRLDRKCSPEVQREVDLAKRRQDAGASAPLGFNEHETAFMVEVVSYAEEHGRLGFQRRPLRMCTVCQEHAGYAKYKRSGRYHRKGQLNTSKPLKFSGVDLSIALVRTEGYASLGCCATCWDKLAEPLAEMLRGCQAQVPEQVTGRKPEFRQHRNMECSKCGWQGHEGQMRMLPTLMRDGHYPGGCPSCEAENHPLGGRQIEAVNGFTLVETGK